MEHDPLHAQLARAHVEREGYADRIGILLGRSRDVLPRLPGPYDVAFFDGDPQGCLADLEQFARLVRPGGLLISSNLFLAQHDPRIPGLEEAAEYRRRILEDGRWYTAFLQEGKALSVRRQP